MELGRRFRMPIRYSFLSKVPSRLLFRMAAALALSLAVPLEALAQPPETILIQGQLLDQNGEALTGLRDFRLRFFDDPAAGAQLGADVLGEVVPGAEGIFGIALVPPLEIFQAAAVWYELAVDSSPEASGLTEESVFPERIRLHSVPFALRSAGLAGEAFVMVNAGSDPVENGLKLLAAHAQAAALTPHGLPLSSGNRASVLLPPGQYDLGAEQLLLDADFVDIEGLSSDPRKQRIFGTTSGPGTGVVRQVANDVRLENLFVECTRASGGRIFEDTDPAAYFPDSELTDVLIRNCIFAANENNAFAMRVGIIYAGRYEDSEGGFAAFGGGGEASGVFIRCIGGLNAFGGLGVASGEFVDCTGGNASFGGGFGNEASGVFLRCRGGNSSFGGNGGTASGSFTDCTGGSGAFGGNNGFASGVFIRCIGGLDTFGGGNTVDRSGLANGTFTGCIGGARSFGGGTDNSAAGGVFRHCAGGPDAFTETGAPALLFCVREDAAFP